MTHRIRGTQAGFTLMELLIAMTLMSVLMGTGVAILRSQTRGFDQGARQNDMLQNLRFAFSTVDRALRTAGAGVASQQPMFVYGGNDVVAFNTNYTTTVQDGCAVNLNPDAPLAATDVMPVGSAFQLPNTAFVYPSMTYAATTCRAETVILYFRPDSTTGDAADFMLLQRVNATLPELVARNLYPYPGRPFFEYFVHRVTLPTPPSPRDSLVLAGAVGSGVALPIIHSVAQHGSPADGTGTASSMADSVKAVRFNIRVSNGLTGAAQRFRDATTVIDLPNNGLVQLKTCGTNPLLGGAVAVTPNAAGNPPSVQIQWPASFDEASGEQDVAQYNIYRRRTVDPAFGSAILSVPAGQPSPYTVVDGSVTALVPYIYAVAAQDCTPLESTWLVSGAVTPN